MSWIPEAIKRRLLRSDKVKSLVDTTYSTGGFPGYLQLGRAIDKATSGAVTAPPPPAVTTERARGRAAER